MFKPKQSGSYLMLVSRISISLLILYAAVATVLLFRLDGEPTVIGIDQYGTRIVTSHTDPILKREKILLVRNFAEALYNFNEINFDERASSIGDWMSDDLWKQKQSEYKTLSDRLKTEPITQTGRVLDIREIDELEFEVDMDLETMSRLRRSESKVRVSIQLDGAKRDRLRPYPYEVKSYEETVLN